MDSHAVTIHPHGDGAVPSPVRNPRTTAGLAQFGRVLVIRLAPGEDVLPCMERLLTDAGITNGVILSGVASLRHATVRNICHLPSEWPIQEDMRKTTTVPGPLEILAMQGNVAPTPYGGSYVHCHLDFSVGAPAGVTYGGHLLEDTIVATTCEIYIAELSGLDVRRVHDPETRTLEIAVDPMLPPPSAPRKDAP